VLCGPPIYSPDISSAPRYTANAKKEVVVSSGSFNTPQLLLLSGIGDAKQLKELGIESIVDLPDVGANLSDHAFVTKPYMSPHATEHHGAWRKEENLAQYTTEWAEKGTGPLTSSIGNHMAFLRLPETDEQLQKYGDPSAGPTSAHFEFLIVVSNVRTV
jgi:choline dehydrogenase-like flavoprotein